MRPWISPNNFRSSLSLGLGVRASRAFRAFGFRGLSRLEGFQGSGLGFRCSEKGFRFQRFGAYRRLLGVIYVFFKSCVRFRAKRRAFVALLGGSGYG